VGGSGVRPGAARPRARDGVSPANELVVYASSPGGADFYVGFARVNEVP
jgi:hypothetical protein